MKTDLALNEGEIESIYYKLNECDKIFDYRMELARKYVPERNVERRAFWEDIILLAAEGLSDKE